MKKSPLKLKPTENQTFILAGSGDEGDLVRRLGLSHEEERRGDFRSACSERYEAFRLIVDVLPEDEAVELDRNHANTRAGLEIIYGSTIDNYLAGDFELAAAQAEMLLDCDPEDSMGATPTLALCYIALGEWDCFDDILPDIDDRSALHALLEAWASFVRTAKPTRRHSRTCAVIAPSPTNCAQPTIRLTTPTCATSRRSDRRRRLSPANCGSDANP